MKRKHVPFFAEMIFVLILSVLLAIACDGGPLSVHVNNECNDNIKLCEKCEHITPNTTEWYALGFDKKGETRPLQIWRKANCLAQWTVTALDVPEEDSKERLEDTVTITAEIVDPENPFDDIFSAKSEQGYVSLAKGNCPDPQL
jgi:hypothetical protein